jgi:asparagine synthase (glutamine-hydrolysing)
MLASMQHRGPDDRDLRVEDARWGEIGLCAARLAVQDTTPRGRQPMVSDRSGAIIVFNGEIYNAGQLRGELVAKRYAFAGTSDTEVILAAYDEWGLGCLERLRGMFGIAIWDGRRDRLVLARDRLGIKPLYYAEAGDVFTFASEVRAILATGLVESRLSPVGLATYLALGAVREPLTIIDSIRELPAGHYGVWTDQGMQLSQYWSLAGAFTDASGPGVHTAALEQVREALREAVRTHLVADVPLGVFLSGGVDSSSLAALTASVSGRLATVSVVFPDNPSFSEQRFIREIADSLDSEHSELELDERGFLETLPDAVAAMDQPTVDGLNTYTVSKAARNAGLTVALSGLGGDELFAGYDSFRQVPALERLRSRAPSTIGSRADRALRLAGNRSDQLDRVAQWLHDPTDRSSAYELQRELFAPGARRTLIPALVEPAAQPITAPAALDPVNQISYLELTHYTRNMLLRDTDAASMAHGLEVRVPFLDHRVVELVASLPGDAKVDGERPKPMLVAALGSLLPKGVADRKKMGFVFPFDAWLRTGLGDEVQDKLTDPAYGTPVAKLLDQAEIAEVWQRFLAGRAHWSQVWALYVLKSWAERNGS